MQREGQRGRHFLGDWELVAAGVQGHVSRGVCLEGLPGDESSSLLFLLFPPRDSSQVLSFELDALFGFCLLGSLLF